MLKIKEMQLLKITTCGILLFCIIMSSCRTDNKKLKTNYSFATDRVNQAILPTSDKAKIDTVYIKNETLVINVDGETYIFKDLIVNAASLNTFLLHGKKQNRFYLWYDYSASFKKINHILSLKWSNNSLILSKFYKIAYNSRDKTNWGWSILYNEKKIPENKTITQIENIAALVKVNEIRKKCGSVVKLSTDKDSIIYNYCSNKAINKMPVFYSDGTLIGEYKLRKSKDPIILGFDPTIKRKFLVRNNFNQNISHFNNIAFYLQQSGANKEAAAILEKIITKFPRRTVAYINLGDAYWGLGNITKAKEAYQTYVDQMKKAGKAQKIPQRVIDRLL